MSDQFPDDHILIERSQKGDRDAFDQLIRKHEARAFQYAMRLTHRPDEASDIVSEAFVRVFNALPSFKFQSAFGTWLYRILTNCYLDARKKEKSRPSVSLETVLKSSDGVVERPIEDTKPDPMTQTALLERAKTLEEAIEKLPEYQRAMITMYHAEGLAYEEIAAALDLPIGTVKSRLNRARIALRELLAGHEELFEAS